MTAPQKIKPPRIRNIRQSIGFAWAGLGKSLCVEKNLQIHAALALGVVAAGFYFGIGRGEWAAIVMTIGMMFAVELINTAIEHLGEAVSGGVYSDTVRTAKDIAAAACLLVALMSLVVGWLVFSPHVFPHPI